MEVRTISVRAAAPMPSAMYFFQWNVIRRMGKSHSSVHLSHRISIENGCPAGFPSREDWAQPALDSLKETTAVRRVARGFLRPGSSRYGRSRRYPLQECSHVLRGKDPS